MPNVRVVRQENAGKPAALDTGVRSARYDIVVMMDGDTVFEPDTVRQLVQPFAGPEVGAVAGNAKVGNLDTVIGAWARRTCRWTASGSCSASAGC